ncbi:hypothetical protein SLE2022_274850 [Rubroshorea leprosula]
MGFGSGVYSVKIDADHQLVIVTGMVNPLTSVKKLVKSGKYAESWSPSSNQKLNEEQPKFVKDDNNNNQMLYLKDEEVHPPLAAKLEMCGVLRIISTSMLGRTLQ